ncbi:MAG: DNA methylase [Clostridia bacterium]|nr:DNA methylase [Clostridia bacterium]
MSEQKSYIAIDLKSFYASVECRERGLDPMTTHLVVADGSRTEKTICLAVSPSLKKYGISGRARLFEAIQTIKEANARRVQKAPGHRFTGKSCDANVLSSDPTLAIDYIVAPPRMAYYMEYSTRVYQVYLKHVSPEDIHVYSVDEVFIDATNYLKASGRTAYDFARMLIRDVLHTTGITATAGIGTNLYLCKVAMDIVAKHVEADEDGVRIAQLDEESYRRKLWTHRPLTDFWRVGRGYAKTLEANGIYTMGDVARCSVGDVHSYYNEDLLYRLFGINAELLIDHAWGWEPCTIAEIKAYKPESNSISSGQVLQCPYDFEKAKLIVREMTDLLVLDLVDQGLVTDQIVLTVGYDVENLTNPEISRRYTGAVTTDHYGRKVPKHAHGTVNLGKYTSSTMRILDGVTELYTRIVNKNLLVRRINVTANRVMEEHMMGTEKQELEQMDMFTDYDALEQERKREAVALEKERRKQKTVIDIKKKYGKNAILRGMNLEEGATARERNRQIGGHKA